MLDLKLPWKKVSVGGPVDTAQWNLSENVRGLHIAVDRENDMIAWPVVVVDPTMEKVSASANAWEPFMLGHYLNCTPSNTAYTVLTLPDGYDIEVDYVSYTTFAGAAPADTVEIYFYTLSWGGGSGGGLWLSLYPNTIMPTITVPGQPVAQWIANTPFRVSTVRTAASSFVASIVTDATAGNRFGNFDIMGRWRQMA